MCGIAGVVGPVGPQERRVVRLMTDAIRHRGPDDEGSFDGAGVSLGMRRLSIIDVEHGKQPVTSEDGAITAVFNGEIYNFTDLQKDLHGRGHRLASESDSECLPHMYEEFGASLVDRLRGMFALAIWDAKSQQLLLARDRVGKKPLFYFQDGSRLWFGSEMKALLAVPSIPRALDPAALDSYLTYQYVPHPQAILKGIRKLPPASILTWRQGRIQITRYWELGRQQDATVSEDELAERLRHELLEATRIRMVSERPLGAFLSGGLDSSAVVAAMARQSGQPLATFSIGFEEDTHNELPYAREVADLYGTHHHELVVRPDITGLLPKIARMFDEPFADSSAVPSYYVAEMARQHAVVVLTGDGGDESFGGYARYAKFMRAPNAWLPLGASLAARAADRADRSSVRHSALRRAFHIATRAAASSPTERYGRMMSYFTPEQKRRLYTDDFAQQVPHESAAYENLDQPWRSVSKSDPVNRLLATDTATYLPGDLLPKVDITTMAVSLEARSPFLDHRLMEWAATIPGEMKVRNGTTKRLLKKALGPWLPDTLIHRTKMGFGIPREAWLQNELQPMVRDLLQSPNTRVSAYLRQSQIDHWIDRNNRFGDAGPRVWSLLMLELWHREVLEK